MNAVRINFTYSFILEQLVIYYSKAFIFILMTADIIWGDTDYMYLIVYNINRNNQIH